MTTNKNVIKLSKFLSLVLRHKPQTIGIQLDENGWTNVQPLLQKMNDYGKTIDLKTLKEVVEKNDKKRFAFDDRGTKIRANQGHSIKIDLGYTAQEPPEILYHGTATKSLPSIYQTGLQKRKRHHVHLSVDLDTATKVGKRHGQLVIFEVAAKLMFQEGHTFFISENGVWLTEAVPVSYLKQLNLS